MNLAKLLVRAGLAAQTAPALVRDGEAPISWAVLNARVAALSAALTHRYGLRPGDRVALFATNAPEFLETLFACWHAGCAAVPVNAKLHEIELRFVLEHCGAKLVVVNGDTAATANAAAAPLAGVRLLETGSADWRTALACEPQPMVARAPEDLAWLFYTSGTTGRPKGAMLTHRNLLAMAHAFCTDVEPVAAGDVLVHAAPMSHGSGLYAVPYVAAMGTQMIPASGGFEAKEIFDICERYRNVSFFAAPTMVVRMLDDAHAAGDLPGLAAIVYGGGPMYLADVKRALEAFGPRLTQIYGQGESPMTITVLPKWMHALRDHPRYEARLASVGYAQSPVEVAVAGSFGEPLEPGVAGEIVVRGSTVMAGYWNDAAATAQALAGGWLRTGDVGTFDDDGFLTLSDRSKDLIITGGSNVYPREVEEVLLAHAGVREVAVVGAPDPHWGETIVAYVVTAPGARVGEPELDRLCLETIARFKRPKVYRFVDTLPKNAYGKVLKTELRALEARP